MERIKSEYSPGQIQAAGGTEHSPVYQAAKKICEDLARMASYDLAPGRTPSDQDFAEYFLYRNKKGYCMHFATAATLMFRAAGIPARYVEGYIVTDKDYVSSDMAEIYDRNAHAWTEIYVAPYGWVPIETTPGFSGDSIAPPEYNTSRPEESAESSEASEAASEVSEGEASSEPLSSAEASAAQPLPSSQTDSGGTGESSDVIPPEEKLSPAAVKGLAASGTIVGVLLLLAGILWLRRRLALNRRKREYAGPDSRQAALAVYRHVERLLAFAGQEPGNETPREFAARLEKEWNGLPQGKSLLRVTVAAEEARFGGGRPYSQENLTLLLEYDRALEKRVADGLSLWGRFRYFLLWNLE